MVNGVGGRKCDWQWPIPENPPIDAKLSQISRTQTEFCLKFCSMATGVDRKKCSLQHSMAHPRNLPPYRRKNLADIFYASRIIANFVPNFVAMATGVGRGIMQLSAFDGPSPKTSYRRKNLAKISCASRVIANFVPNFVAMTTGVGRGKMQLAAFDGPSPNPPYRPRRKNLAKISYASRVIAHFVPNFVAMATREGPGKIK